MQRKNSPSRPFLTPTPEGPSTLKKTLTAHGCKTHRQKTKQIHTAPQSTLLRLAATLLKRATQRKQETAKRFQQQSIRIRIWLFDKMLKTGTGNEHQNFPQIPYKLGIAVDLAGSTTILNH